MKSISRRSEWFAVVFALLLPTLVTLVYFIWAANYESSIQQVAYALAKGVQFLFPVFWVVVVIKGRPIWQAQPGGTRKSLLQGGVFGLAIMIAMVILYYGVIRSLTIFQEPASRISAKIASLGMESSGLYIGMAIFYSVLHSLLEEYYWRWFVFRQLGQIRTTPVAILISSLGFMAHHVVVLSSFFGWTSPLTWLFSLSVAIGGAYWAWLYHRNRSILGPWLSHALIDAAIFLIGYDLAF
jgi:membrane protease YdiL (CAAX protease family)